MYEEVEGVTSQPLIIKCHLCGATERLDDYGTSSPFYNTMREQHVCFSCAFWLDKIQNPPADREIIKGHHYTIHPTAKRPDNILRGFNGKEFFIRRFDGTLIKSNNVWHQGEIPERFRKDLLDTATFISLMTFQRLQNDSHRCLAKGCWDRYHCFRYDLSCEKDGAFNKIPTNHHIGDEHCPSFINIAELK